MPTESAKLTGMIVATQRVSTSRGFCGCCFFFGCLSGVSNRSNPLYHKRPNRVRAAS